MRKIRRRSASRNRVDRGVVLPVSLLAIALVASAFAAPAQAGLGYEPPAVNSTRSLPGIPRGVAVDPVSQDIYVAIVSTDLFGGDLGEIDRFNSDLSADGVFAAEGGYYSGVALDPVTSGFYGAQVEIRGSFGNFGTSKLDKFSSLGAPTGSSALPFPAALPQIATDSLGNVFYPNLGAHSVQVFNPAGTLIETITCGGCPGGSFGEPASVALSSADALYVADAFPDRVVKLTRSGGSYSFTSTVQSGRGAGAVAVDPATGAVLVGDMPDGKDFHIVAYDSSGTQFDDFAAGIFPDSKGDFGSLAAYQMAVSGTTHKLYVAEDNKLHVFEEVTIDPPAATIKSATGVGQITATLNATVNANGHAVLECEFEYTDENDFLANGFTNAIDLPCPEKPDGSSVTALKIEAPGLAPAMKYRYRVTATSNAGSASSGNKTFETFPEIAPTVTTESPLAVTQAGATIKGKVNPHGGSASDCHFDFGTSPSYGSSLPCASLPGLVASDVAESKDVAGLQHSTTYHYRLVVSTNAGTVQGNDVEFRTASPPAEPGPEEPEPEEPAPGPVVAPHPPRCAKGFQRRTVRGKARCVKVCRKGFRRKRLHGKVTCVRSVRSNRQHRRHYGQ